MVNLNNPNDQPVMGLGDLIQELDGEKQQFEDTTKRPQTEDQEAEVVEEPKSPGKSKSDNEVIEPEVVRDYTKTAKNWFRTIDTPITFGAGLIAKVPAKEMAMSKEDQEYLIEQLADVAEVNDWRDPGALPSLIIGAIFGYGEMMFQAFQMRKERVAEEKAAKAAARKAKEEEENNNGTVKQ